VWRKTVCLLRPGPTEISEVDASLFFFVPVQCQLQKFVVKALTAKLRRLGCGLSANP